MADLLTAAQAVMHAATMGNSNVMNDQVYKQCIAATLRAVADQVVPANPDMPERWEEKDEIRADILTIATELENQ